MSTGIYKILNKLTNECYIGQAINIELRLGKHLSSLRNNNHIYYTSKNKTILQNTWNKYSEENFKFEIIEECSEEMLNEREIYWINYYNCNRNKSGKGYNLNDGGYGNRGYRYTEQDKIKVSNANKGRIHLNNGKEMKFVFPEEIEELLKNGFIYGELPRSDEAKEKYKNGSTGNTNVKGRIHINNGEIGKLIKPEEFDYYISIGFSKGMLQKHLDNINKNKKQSEETIKKRSEAMKGKIGWSKVKKLSEEHKYKIGQSSKGRVKSNETKEKIKIANSKSVLQYDKYGKLINKFLSGVEAQEKTNIQRSHISQCCKGKRKTAGGYIWEYENK